VRVLEPLYKWLDGHDETKYPRSEHKTVDGFVIHFHFGIEVQVAIRITLSFEALPKRWLSLPSITSNQDEFIEFRVYARGHAVKKLMRKAPNA
jgi:hypothetical protein